MSLRIAIALLVLSLSASAYAQDHGATVGGSVAAVNMDSQTDLAFTGTFGYRFTRVFGMEIDVTAAPDLHSPFGDDFLRVLSGGTIIQSFPGPSLNDAGGRQVIFTNNARIEIPTTAARLTPYFVAGGGIASTRRSGTLIYFAPAPTTIVGVPPVPIGTVAREIRYPVSSSSTDLALTLGGGVGVRVVSRMSVDVDLRVIRLMGGEQDRNVGRFGVGVRYRF